MRGFLQGLGIFGAIIGFFLIVGVLVAGGWAIKYYTADVRGKINANEQIKSGDNRIAQYDSFFNQCAAVQSFETSLEAAYNALDRNTDPSDTNRLNINITGIEAQRARAINEYNANAAKNYTDGQFRDIDLPYQIRNTEYKRGIRTTCAAN